MLRRFSSLFQRYADVHARARFRRIAFPKGAEGYFDLIEAHHGTLRIVGWTSAEQVTLFWDGGERSAAPWIDREDVAIATGVDRTSGFEFEVPLAFGPFRFGASSGASSKWIDLPISDGRVAAGRMRTLPAFVLRLAQSLPDIVLDHTSSNPRFRARVKHRLGLDGTETAGFLDPDCLDLDPQPTSKHTPVDILMPVYNAFDVLPEALDRVEKNTDVPWHLWIVEDRSTDERVWPFLQQWAADRTATVSLLRNERNKGFLQSINYAINKTKDRQNPVLLLNSDALVPPGWASRMLAPMLTDSSVASVTPASNDAEIFSAPTICKTVLLNAGEGDAIDNVARQLAGVCADAPTGVGFCMLLRREFLDKVPAFDTAFGQGYGEEVDWCQKVRKLGGRHLGTFGVFVEHRGGQSFGSERKRAAIAKNNALISARYPNYDREVQKFIRNDPLLTPRIALGLAFLSAHAKDRVSVYLAHSLGGGAEHDLQRRLKSDIKRNGGAVVLRVGGSARWQIEVITASGASSGKTDDTSLVFRLLDFLPRRRIVYSCGVGDRAPSEIPALLLRLKESAEDGGIEVLFHDYFPVSPSYCLLDGDGVYRGPVTPERSDAAHSWIAGPKVQSIADWQNAWGPLLEEADKVTVFSDASRQIVKESYPSIAAKITVAPHSSDPSVAPVLRTNNRQPVLAALGNINRQKGLEVLRDVAKEAQREGGYRVMVIGKVDPTRPLPAYVPVHGGYQVKDIPDLAQHYGVTHWVVPSIWPETFSFTTREALATGLPVITFDLGAQGEAARDAANGYPVAIDPTLGASASLQKALPELLGR